MLQIYKLTLTHQHTLKQTRKRKTNKKLLLIKSLTLVFYIKQKINYV